MRRRRSSSGSFGFARLGAKNRLAPVTSTRIYSYRISAIQVFFQIPIDLQTDRYSVGFWEGLEARDRGVGFRICAAVQGPRQPAAKSIPRHTRFRQFRCQHSLKRVCLGIERVAERVCLGLRGGAVRLNRLKLVTATDSSLYDTFAAQSRRPRGNASPITSWRPIRSYRRFGRRHCPTGRPQTGPPNIRICRWSATRPDRLSAIP